MAPAALDNHVLVLLEDDVGALVEVEDGDRGELRGAARRLKENKNITINRRKIIVNKINMGIKSSFGNSNDTWHDKKLFLIYLCYLWELVRVHRVHERLHDGVVGGVHVDVEGEVALAVAVERLVVVGGDDPVLKNCHNLAYAIEGALHAWQY